MPFLFYLFGRIKEIAPFALIAVCFYSCTLGFNAAFADAGFSILRVSDKYMVYPNSNFIQKVKLAFYFTTQVNQVFES